MSSNTPIPSRLADCFVISDDRGDTAAKGFVKCTCGCESFSILYFGKRGKLFFPNIIKTKTSEGRRMVLIAKCRNCNKSILIYDSMIDGHKNYKHQAPAYLGPYDSFTCDKCNENNFTIEIAFNSLGKGVLERQHIQNWNDCFEMILVSAQCKACGKDYNGLLEE